MVLLPFAGYKAKGGWGCSSVADHLVRPCLSLEPQPPTLQEERGWEQEGREGGRKEGGREEGGRGKKGRKKQARGKNLVNPRLKPDTLERAAYR